MSTMIWQAKVVLTNRKKKIKLEDQKIRVGKDVEKRDPFFYMGM